MHCNGGQIHLLSGWEPLSNSPYRNVCILETGQSTVYRVDEVHGGKFQLGNTKKKGNDGCVTAVCIEK